MLLLDGPLGTELSRRGVSTALPLFGASALIDAPEVVRAIHRDYAGAGATLHTANTFRTTTRAMGDEWERWARLAVILRSPSGITSAVTRRSSSSRRAGWRRCTRRALAERAASRSWWRSSACAPNWPRTRAS